MIETRRIKTAPGLVFDVSVGGAEDAPLVLMLHGFCVSRHFWSNQLPALAAAGFFAVAPNQRGYSADARPDPTDFGGSLAWLIADRYPERLGSLTMPSRPHPAAFARALAMPDGEQKHRSRHHHEFLDPGAGPRLLADHAAWMRTRLARNGVPDAAIEAHLSVIGNPPAMEAALAWYRARGERQPIGPTTVPTLFIWGDADDTVGRAAAEGTGEFIAAPYRFEALPGVGHYASDQVPERVNALLLEHLARHPL
jgi:pimeloyl-ACP methyl ester carboxylesterase